MVPKLTRRLRDDCYMFYSEGDEQWHRAEEGLAALESLMSVSLSSVGPEVREKARDTIQCLVGAATHWHDIELIKNENDIDSSSYSSIRSELASKCEQLMRLGSLGREGVRMFRFKKEKRKKKKGRLAGYCSILFCVGVVMWNMEWCIGKF